MRVVVLSCGMRTVGLQFPGMALRNKFDRAAVEQHKRWREYFGQPLPDEALVPCPISIADREYLLSLGDVLADAQNSSTPAWTGSDRSDTCLVGA